MIKYADYANQKNKRIKGIVGWQSSPDQRKNLPSVLRWGVLASVPWSPLSPFLDPLFSLLSKPRERWAVSPWEEQVVVRARRGQRVCSPGFCFPDAQAAPPRSLPCTSFECREFVWWREKQGTLSCSCVRFKLNLHPYFSLSKSEVRQLKIPIQIYLMLNILPFNKDMLYIRFISSLKTKQIINISICTTSFTLYSY